MDDVPGATEEPRRPEHEPAVVPHLAPAPGPPPAPRRSALPVGLGALAAAAIVIGLVAWGLAPRSTPATIAGDRVRLLEPIQPRADAQTGEQVAPFSGFAVSVDTVPGGALVSVGGVPRGEAPVLAGLECSPGDQVEITAEKSGFAVARTTTLCRADTLVKLTVRLRR
jgi:hypothetical protein